MLAIFVSSRVKMWLCWYKRAFGIHRAHNGVGAALVEERPVSARTYQALASTEDVSRGHVISLESQRRTLSCRRVGGTGLSGLAPSCSHGFSEPARHTGAARRRHVNPGLTSARQIGEDKLAAFHG